MDFHVLSPTSGGFSVGIVRSGTKATELEDYKTLIVDDLLLLPEGNILIRFRILYIH
jgi:hypothetical protein